MEHQETERKNTKLTQQLYEASIELESSTSKSDQKKIDELNEKVTELHDTKVVLTKRLVIAKL